MSVKPEEAQTMPLLRRDWKTVRSVLPCQTPAEWAGWRGVAFDFPAGCSGSWSPMARESHPDGSAEDEVGDLLGLVDLDVVAGAVDQVQFAVGEQGGEVLGDVGVEVAVAGAEDHLDRWGEAAQLLYSPAPG